MCFSTQVSRLELEGHFLGPMEHPVSQSFRTAVFLKLLQERRVPQVGTAAVINIMKQYNLKQKGLFGLHVLLTAHH